MCIRNVSDPGSSRLRGAVFGNRFRHRLSGQWRLLLCQGLSPHALALGLAVGAAVGVLPTLWGTSLLCFALAWMLRLNHLATQFANFLVYPLQLSLVGPCFLLGQTLAPETFAGLSMLPWGRLHGEWPPSPAGLLTYQACAATGWLLLAPGVLVVTYLLARCLLIVHLRRQVPGAGQVDISPQVTI